ncbi:MAG: MFS transporter [Lachnospiraceae bacterium]|nr:MFS transporter [Lachnospiraceae bacterium]
MGAVCVGCMFAGYMIHVVSPRIIMIIAAICVLAGFFLTSGIVSLTGLYLCYGVFCGFGVGIGYNSILSSILKWFPDKTGILSGILLMGFGFGGSILGNIAVSLMNETGWRMAFKILGVVLACVIILSTFVLWEPNASEIMILSKRVKVRAAGNRDYTTKEMVKSSSFYVFFLGCCNVSHWFKCYQ